jgi:predicted permease
MHFVAAELKHAFRRLRRAPFFTGVALVTLAIGIGGNTAIFSVIEGILLKPLSYSHPEELVSLELTAPGINVKDADVAPSDYFIFREQNRTLRDLAVYEGYSVNITGSGEPEHAAGLLVTDGLLPILGVSPMLGRSFTHADDSPDAPATVMLSYGYWRHKFGGDRSVIGKTLTIDAKLHQIIGVMPQNFRFRDERDLAVLLPMQLDRAKTVLGQFNFGSVARMKPGITLDQVNADVARMLPIVLRSFPPPPGYSIKLFEDARIGPNSRSMKQDVVGDVGKVLWVLMGGLGLVLLIACANVANLLLVRAEGREQELSIRAALGASRLRIAGELFLESLVLALLGSALGLGLAYGALRGLLALAPAGLPRLDEIGLDLTVVLFTLALSLVSSLLFGSIPVLKYAGVRVSTGLRESCRSMSESRRHHRSRNTLVVIQVALAVILLISSGLMIRTFMALTRVNPGFVAPAQLQTFRVDIPDTQVKEPERVMRVEEDILHKIEAVPGVTSAALSMSVPMDGNEWGDSLLLKDRTFADNEIPLHRYRFVAPGYFNTLGTPLIAGRDITWGDIYNKVPVAIVSEKVARMYWHDPARALGQQIRPGGNDEWREIVGVVGNTREDGVDKDVTSSVFWPILAAHFETNDLDVRRYVTYSIRTSRAGSEGLMKEVRHAVWSVDPDLPLSSIHTLAYYYRESMARTSFTLVMLAVAGGMALLLGVVGLYGVIAYSVSQRRREIGIRMALGAQDTELTGMFVRHALLLTGAGVACGLVAAPALTHLMSSLLFGVKSVDAATYTSVSLGLIATAALASYLPARRAAAVNPVESLRGE